MIRLAPLITADVDATMLPGGKTTNTAQDFLALLGEALSGDTAADKTALQLPVTTDNAPIKGESLVSDILAEDKQPDLLPPVNEIHPVINNEQSITPLTTAQAVTPTAAPDKDTAKKTDDLNEDVAASLNALFAMLPGFDNTPKVTATPPRALPEMKQSLTTQIHFAQSDDANDSALSTSAKSLTSLVAKARTNAEVISTPSPAVTIVSPLISSHQTQPHLTASAPVLSTPLGSHEWQQTLSQHISLFTRQGQQHAELRLHPQALGEVQIQMVSPHQHVRAALEAALPVLRTQLAESGIQLGQSDISGESFSNQQQATSQQQQSPRTASHERQAGEDDDELSIPASLQGRVSGNSGVDIFA
ncbi:flagellar hook-length control protein FliK [Escherichia albertii]|uniref:flagellar hook-length control protein FliK n=1 Tax=Escherichia albertii TaxID=208962 RepID=UPI0003D84E2B|nr:flagellar hook-length control protein FliK [Escherichia albertii]AHE61913.1 flagellar hook-length control protein [Escherichia albertii KF1]EFE6908287.1 flagellar hook-length control protein FliK [Escherichia albertii]MCZ8723871.1 flagellar hook-length control protein FliK [Escherichia albertii]MCZ8737046.1 flagellar hook-length control protein FliK [Escherichia albertii]MCZ8802533.1 flagellar hook-length control protein FliK [Escherichia albertii]